jgi:pilus assembly protein CpaC
MRFVVRLLYVAVLVFIAQAAGAEELRLGVGAQRVLNLPAPITRIVVGQGGIIDATALNEDQLQITGLQSGQTTLAVFTAQSEQGISYDVVVGAAPAVALPTIPDRGDPARQIRGQPGLQGVRVNRDGDTLVLSGSVPDLDAHARASSIARAYGGGNVVDLTRVTGNQMVAVDIQFAAVSATTLRALGFHFAALGGSDFQGALPFFGPRTAPSPSSIMNTASA